MTCRLSNAAMVLLPFSRMLNKFIEVHLTISAKFRFLNFLKLPKTHAFTPL
jgi:hypothetical protein